jgi:hypothetical protein
MGEGAVDFHAFVVPHGGTRIITKKRFHIFPPLEKGGRGDLIIA